MDRSAEFAKLAGASGIQVVRDDLEATVLRLEFEPGHVEWVVFNPSEGTIEAAGQKSRKAYDYFQVNTANK